jgi:hypothetical protein
MMARVLPQVSLDTTQRVVGAIAQVAHEYVLVLGVVIRQDLCGRVVRDLISRERVHVVDDERREEAVRVRRHAV